MMLRKNRFVTMLVLAVLLLSACQLVVPTSTELGPEVPALPEGGAIAKVNDVEQPAVVPLAGMPDTPRPDAPTYGVRGPYAVGTREIVVEPASARPLPVTVWYPAVKPADVEERITYTEHYPPVFENYTVAGRAIRDAAFDLTAGPYPLVVFSTGLNASRLIAVNFTEHLASYGFVVVAPDHPGTTPVDAAGDDQYWPMYVERPQDIQRVIGYAETATAENGEFAGLIDPERTAVTGASSGSLGTFAAGGALLDLTRCLDPAEELECNQIQGHEEELAALAGLETVPEGIWPPIFEHPVDAIVPIVPDYGLYGLDDVGVASVQVPTLILGGGGDTVNPVDQGAIPFYERIGSEHKGLVILDNAWHIFLVNACPANPWMATDAGWGHWFCSDPVWDMQRAHDLSNHFVTAFLLAELKGDAEAAAALAPKNISFTGVTYQVEGYATSTELDAEASALPEGGAIAQVNDIEMYYEIHGEGEPVLLIHSVTGSTAQFADVIPMLAEKYQVIALDFRGHGRTTDSGQPLSYELMASDVVALMDTLGIDAAHIVGNKDGGIIGLVMAVKYPERVNRLMAASVNWSPDGFQPWFVEYVKNVTYDDWDAMAGEMYRSVAPDPNIEDVMLEKVRNLLLTQPNFTLEELGAIAAPVLVLAGADEEVLQIPHVEELATAIPNAELVLIDEAGHGVLDEQFEAWMDAMLAFLDQAAVEPVVTPPAQLPDETVAAIRQTVEARMAKSQIPGFAVAVVQNGELVYAEGFGVAELGTDRAVTPETVFQLASTSKPIAAIAIMQLAELGKLRLDAPVTDYLPYFKLADERYRDITIEQILTHRSGLPEGGGFLGQEIVPEYDDGAAERYVRGLADLELLFAPGEDWAYSDMGYNILGDVIAKVSGLPFEEYVQQHIFTPLGMKHTTFLLSEVPTEALAFPHMQDESGQMAGAGIMPYTRPFAPSDTLYSSVTDMSRLARASFNHGELDGNRILGEES